MKLAILLRKPNTKPLAIIFIITFILTFVCLSIIFPPYLAQFPENAGLMAIKNAWNKENMDKIIDIWKEEGDLDYYVELMRLVHWIDFGFMAIYGTALASGSILAARMFEGKEKMQKFYLYFFVVSLIAVILDVIEGINIFIMLGDVNNISDINAFTASLSTLICIWIVYAGLFLILIGLICGIILYKKN